jgi:hypothetical protein
VSRCGEAGASNLSRPAEVGGLLELSFNFCDRDTHDPAVLDYPEREPLRRVLNGLREMLLVEFCAATSDASSPSTKSISVTKCTMKRRIVFLLQVGCHARRFAGLGGLAAVFSPLQPIMRAELRREAAAIANDQAQGVGTTHPRLEAALTARRSASRGHYISPRKARSGEAGASNLSRSCPSFLTVAFAAGLALWRGKRFGEPQFFYGATQQGAPVIRVSGKPANPAAAAHPAFRSGGGARGVSLSRQARAVPWTNTDHCPRQRRKAASSSRVMGKSVRRHRWSFSREWPAARAIARSSRGPGRARPRPRRSRHVVG